MLQKFSKKDKQKNKILFLIPITLFFWIFIPKILTIGMFFDGLTHSSIARNLIEKGNIWKNIWHLQYTETTLPWVIHYPFFAYLIQGIIYSFSPDNLYLDKIQSVLFGFLTLIALHIFWNKYKKDNKINISSWWFLTLWLLIPLTRFIINNNLLENILVLFITISTIFMLYKNFYLSILSGIFLFFAFLIKGPMCLFIIFYPLIKYKIYKISQFKKVFCVSIITFIILLLSLLLFSKDARNFFYANFIDMKKSFYEYRTVSSRSYIIKELINQLIYPIGFIIIISLCLKGFKIKYNSAIDLLITGFFGFIPYIFATKQYDRYLYPALIFFIGYFSSLSENIAKKIEVLLTKRNNLIILIIFSSIITIISFYLMIKNKNKIVDQIDFHNDFTLQSYKFPKKEIIGTCPSYLAYNWDLVASFQRYLKVSLTTNTNKKYLLIDNDKIMDCEKFIKICKKIHPPKAKKYSLYKCFFNPINYKK